MKVSINESLETLELLKNHVATGLDGLTGAYMDKHDAEMALAVAAVVDDYRDWMEYRTKLKKLEVTADTEQE